MLLVRALEELTAGNWRWVLFASFQRTWELSPTFTCKAKLVSGGIAYIAKEISMLRVEHAAWLSSCCS